MKLNQSPHHFCLFLVFFLLCFVKASAQDTVIRTGWFPFEPYMYTEERYGIPRLTGLDIRMLEAVIKKLEAKPDFTQVPWKQFQEDIKTGKLQIAPFATETEDRKNWAYFTDPYRFEENVLYVKRGSPLAFKSVADLMQKMKETHFRLGVMEGFVYADPKINEFIHDPSNKDSIVTVNSEMQNLNNLLKDKIDGFFTDRLVGGTLVWRSGERTKVEERLLGISTPIHFLMSKVSTTPEMVQQVNKIIADMRQSGEHKKIVQQYILPVLLMQTIDRPWFTWVEIFAVIAFVIAGMIIADQEKFNILSAFGLAIVPSFGGGLVRDIIVNRYPVGILVNPRYTYTVLITFVTILCLVNLYDYMKNRLHWQAIDRFTPQKNQIKGVVNIMDALGTSAFTVIGVLVAVLGRADPLWVWGPLLAVMSGIGGSTIRNSLAGYRALGNDLVYAEIPLLCGLGLSLFLDSQTDHIDPALIFAVVMATIGIGFMAHMLVYYFHIPSLKIHMFPQRAPSPPLNRKKKT